MNIDRPRFTGTTWKKSRGFGFSIERIYSEFTGAYRIEIRGVFWRWIFGWRIRG